MNRIVINGKTLNCSGSNISIINNQIFVDGKQVSGDVTKKCDVHIYGDVGNIDCEGSVSCNNVNGDIFAGGSVNCDDVGGNVHCGGSCNCDEVKGNVNAGGSVRM